MPSTIPNLAGTREPALFCATTTDASPLEGGATVDFVTAVRALLPPESAAAQAEFDQIIAESLDHERWSDPATVDRYGMTEDQPGHPLSGRCGWDARPIAECGGPPATRNGWLYGSKECAGPHRVTGAGQIVANAASMATPTGESRGAA